MGSERRFEKGAIVGAMTAAMVALCAVVLAAHGASEEGVREIIRWTARFSVSAFMLAFAARPLRQLWSSTLSGWMLRNRRYLGVSFAVAHFTHLGGIIALGVLHPDPFLSEVDAVTLVGGGFGYVMIVLMTLTSTDRTAAWLSRRNWRRMHTLGMVTLWVIFTVSYVPRALIESLVYAPVSLALVSVLGLRIWAWVAAREGRGSAPVTAN